MTFNRVSPWPSSHLLTSLFLALFSINCYTGTSFSFSVSFFLRRFQSEWGLAQLLKMSVATLDNLSSMGPWNSHSRRKSIPIPLTPTDVNARICAWGYFPPTSHNKVILCSFKHFNQITYCIRFQIFMEVFNSAIKNKVIFWKEIVLLCF